MKQVISDTRIPIKIWTDDIEPAALAQLKNVSALPFVFKHVAAMPDVHLGWGSTIGSVIATKNAIMPAAVGVDIGCGMMAVKTDLDHRRVRDEISDVRHDIERSIPVGFNSNRKIKEEVLAWPGWKNHNNILVDPDLWKKAQSQLSSLGGGNHFIEVCLDKEDAVWIMLHSGSRGVGNITARRHIEKAKGLMKRMFIDLPDPDLAYFISDTKEFADYINDLNWCQDYASDNRVIMMSRIARDLSYRFNNKEPLTLKEQVNCHHNYCVIENHFGENVYVTRKGAVRARKGDLGIIPGSMGTKSYIVRGLGNPQSFHSCSHGAGRRMSRTRARKEFTVDDLKKQTEGVECRKDKDVIDEIPGAYKSIDEVMENQKDLVEVVAELKQIMCVKG